MSDICACINGRSLYIEVKDTGKPEIGTILQEEFLQNMREAEAIGFVANSLDTVKEVLRNEGLL